MHNFFVKTQEGIADLILKNQASKQLMLQSLYVAKGKDLFFFLCTSFIENTSKLYSWLF